MHYFLDYLSFFLIGVLIALVSIFIIFLDGFDEPTEIYTGNI
jgi:hypothetical protein